MTAPIKQVSFSGGEIAPALYGRTDHVKYESGLRTLRNMLAMRHGGVTMRPGTMYVGTTLNGGAQVRLIPFIFNETGNGQSYLLEFGNLYVAFYQNGGVVISGGNPYTVVTPYLQADLQTLQFAQCADILTITHPNYPIKELARVSATNWTLTQPTFGAPLSVGLVTLSGTAGTTNQNYVVTAVNGLNEESDSLNAGAGGAINLVAPSSSAPITLSWSAVTGAISYRVYRLAPSASLGPYGYIGQTTNNGFVDSGFTPDYTNTYPLRQVTSVRGVGGKGTVATLFGQTGDYPSTVGFVQQRRCFANTTNNPIGFWMSFPGDFYNFDTHVTPIDSDAIFATLFGEQVNSIQHVLEQKFMLLLTTGSEVYVQGNGNGVVTPSAINASTQSQYGSSPLRPLKVGDVLLFNQALGSFIRDFAFDFAIDGYRGNDITVFSAHLVEGYSLADWGYQKIPDSIVWAVRNDGVLLGCTYVREQQILAWHRHDFVNGTVENICSVPENGQYAVYLSIKRVINGSTVRYIERMSSRIWTDPLNATYLDCFSSFNGVNGGSTTMTLTASGSFQTGSTAYQQQLTLTASASFFTSGMVGDEIFINDALFISSQGSKGNQIRCTIQAFTSATVVTVTPNRAVPAEFQNAATTVWSRAVKTLSGLTYLAGQQVSVWADRFVVGSPLNVNISNTYTIPSSGILTLDKCYAVIYIGLPIVADFQTLDLETSFGETMIARRKRQAKLAMYTLNARSFFVGSEDPDTNLDNSASDPLFQLEEWKRGGRATYDQPPELVTDQDYVIEATRWNKNGRIFIRNVDPVPLSILAVVPAGDSPAQSPNYEKV